MQVNEVSKEAVLPDGYIRIRTGDGAQTAVSPGIFGRLTHECDMGAFIQVTETAEQVMAIRASHAPAILYFLLLIAGYMVVVVSHG